MNDTPGNSITVEFSCILKITLLLVTLVSLGFFIGIIQNSREYPFRNMVFISVYGFFLVVLSVLVIKKKIHFDGETIHSVQLLKRKSKRVHEIQEIKAVKQTLPVPDNHYIIFGKFDTITVHGLMKNAPEMIQFLEKEMKKHKK